MSKKAVSVQFLDGGGYNRRTYDFFTDLPLVMGDTVVVDCQTGLQLAKVVSANLLNHQATKWVVSKVDLEAHKARIEKEAKIKDVKRQLEDRYKKLKDIELYKLLAKDDVVMATLLEELGQLEN